MCAAMYYQDLAKIKKKDKKVIEQVSRKGAHCSSHGKHMYTHGSVQIWVQLIKLLLKWGKFRNNVAITRVKPVPQTLMTQEP